MEPQHFIQDRLLWSYVLAPSTRHQVVRGMGWCAPERRVATLSVACFTGLPGAGPAAVRAPSEPRNDAIPLAPGARGEPRVRWARPRPLPGAGSRAAQE